MKVEIVGITRGLGKYEDLNIEEIISAIARHGVIKEDNGKLVKYLMDNAHWSPLDMVNIVFEVETSRAIGRQWLRHVSLKPQEHSQRYSDRVEFENIELRLEDKVNRQSSTEVVATLYSNDGASFCERDYYTELAIEGLDLLDAIKDFYQKGIELGIAKECMRNFLPECTTSTLTFNGSLRSWLAFLNVRCDRHAQKEIQELANLIGKELEKQMPTIFNRIEWKKGMFM